MTAWELLTALDQLADRGQIDETTPLKAMFTIPDSDKEPMEILVNIDETELWNGKIVLTTGDKSD
jgi:nitrogen fixation protein